jgi:hypothetical protein
LFWVAFLYQSFNQLQVKGNYGKMREIKGKKGKISEVILNGSGVVIDRGPCFSISTLAGNFLLF